MACRGDNVGSCGNEELSSSSYGASGGGFALTRMQTESSLGSDPLGECRADAFWEEILLPSPCSGVLFNLRASICGLHGWGPRCDEFHLLVGDPHIEGLRFPLPLPRGRNPPPPPPPPPPLSLSSPVPTIDLTPPRSCSCEHCPSSAGYERAE